MRHQRHLAETARTLVGVEHPVQHLLAARGPGLDDPAFRALFAKSPVKRIGRERFIRNVLYALGNSGDPALMRAVEPHLGDPSPLVRGAAVWAAGRLMDAEGFARLRTARLATETDETVRAEWAAAP